MVLIDTSVLIDFFRGKKSKPSEQFRDILVNNIPFGITSFIYQELLQGAKTQKEFNKLKMYLETQKFYMPQNIPQPYEETALIFFELRKRGITVKNTIDCLIVQIALEHNLFLLHNDRDFDKFSKVVDIKIYK